MDRAGVVALIANPDVSHVAWRVTRPLAALAAVGYPTGVISIEGANLDGFTWHPVYRDIELPAARVLLLHHPIVPPRHRDSFVAWLAKLRADGMVIVLDTDDDCYSEAWAQHLVASRFNGADEPGALEEYDTRRRESEWHAWPLGVVDAVTVSTQHLADVVAQFTTAPVYVVPNLIDVDAFTTGRSRRGQRPWPDHISVGWCAGYRPHADAADVAEAWARLARARPYVRFVIAGAPQPLLENAVPADRLRRVPQTTIDAYPWGMQVDVGCCGAADTAFNRSRSPIKAWEFALAGAAVIASPVVYGELDGDALFAETPDEWYAHLIELTDNPFRRDAAWTRLYDRVHARHALAKNLWRISDVYNVVQRHNYATVHA